MGSAGILKYVVHLVVGAAGLGHEKQGWRRMGRLVTSHGRGSTYKLYGVIAEVPVI